MNFDLQSIAQFVILTCGVACVILATSRNAMTRRWSGPIGVFSEPFWFYASYTNEQWGILLLSIVYFTRWAQCTYRDWFSNIKVTECTV